MKKIIFSLVALVAAMSMNAQVMKVYKDGAVVAKFKAAQMDSVVYNEVPVLGNIGTAKRSGNIDVNWVQLWENGPKFAEYNVGAANNNAEDYGGYYCWGSSIDKDSNTAYKSGTDPLSGTDDTATNLWGSDWRMPTQAELQALLDSCDMEWTIVNGVNGRKFTGRGDYDSSSLFLPAAGRYDEGSVSEQGIGFYWTSTALDEVAYLLIFSSDVQFMNYFSRFYGFSVRAVLAE